MFDLFLFCVGIFIGYQISKIIIILYVRRILIEEAEARGVDVKTLLENNRSNSNSPETKQLDIEHINNVLYLYDKETGSFLCQATTIEELSKLAKEYKNINSATVLDPISNKNVAFVDGKVKHEI